MKGQRILRPLEATRLNRPRRSINITVACGTILIVLAAMISSTMPIKKRKKTSRNAGRTPSDCNRIKDANDIIHLRQTYAFLWNLRRNYNESRARMKDQSKKGWHLVSLAPWL